MMGMEIASEPVSAATVPGAGSAALRAETSGTGEFAGLLQSALSPPSGGAVQAAPVFPGVPPAVSVGPLTAFPVPKPGGAAAGAQTSSPLTEFAIPPLGAEAVPTQTSSPSTNSPEATPAAIAALPNEKSLDGFGEAAASDEAPEEPQAFAAPMSGESLQASTLISPASLGEAKVEVPSGELPAERIAEGEPVAAADGDGAPTAAPNSIPQPQAVTAEFAG